MSHVLLEASAQLSNTIFRYQRGKHVMAEPSVLPLRSPVPFDAGTREDILGGWDRAIADLNVNVCTSSPVTAIEQGDHGFTLTVNGETTWTADAVILAIGLQGNLRKLGVTGDSLPRVQYQLDDPAAYKGERIYVVGAGDAAIENALALAPHNKVTLVNRRDEFARAKDANNTAVLRAADDRWLTILYKAAPTHIADADDHSGITVSMKTAEGEQQLAADRVIARLGAIPPRRLVESFGITFPSDDPNAVPAVSEQYESNVPGLYIVGALAGYPLIKQAMNQGYEVVEYILGNDVEPADEALLRERMGAIPGFTKVNDAIDRIRTNVPLFADVGRLPMREFMLDSDVRVLSAGETVFEKGDYTNSLISIVEGRLRVVIHPDNPNRDVIIETGKFVGEMGLLSGRRRNATVRADTDCVLIDTPRRSMVKLIHSVESVARQIDRAFITRALATQLTPGAPNDAVEAAADLATIQQFSAGEVLFHEGDAGDALHLIRSGSVTVSKHIENRDVVLAYVPAGKYVGEMALFADAPRSATVRATVATETIRLKGDAFKRLMAANAGLREVIEARYTQQTASNAAREARGHHDTVFDFLMAQGVGTATDVLLIDESLCVRCDHCEKACADTHGNVSRLDREAGPTMEQLHVPTSCRHCENPHCMKDCPPDAIHRKPGGEVFIDSTCIGCGNCERNCPFGVIQMGVESDTKPSLWQWLILGRGAEPGLGDAGAGKQKKAVKCDMCADVASGPACVAACPTGAAIRVSPEQFFEMADGGR